MNKSKTYIATAPGATIKEQLENRSMTQKEFSKRMDMSEKHISKLINGEVQLTVDVANRLEMVLGLPAQFWNNLESIYRGKLLLVQEENEMDADIEKSKIYPYKEMVEYKWVQATSNPTEKVRNLRKFFEVTKLTLLESDSFIPHIACRKLSHTQKSDIGLIVWAQEAKIISRSIETDSINIKALKENLSKIRKMTRLLPAKFCSELKCLLAENGIALVFLPHVKGSGIHGATFLDGDKIVLGLTVRGKDADKFWFSLFHEIGHIVLGHIGKIEVSEADEKAADEFARDTLIPQLDYKAFTAGKNFTKRSITDFADSMEVDSGIVLGRLQKDGFVKYSSFNELKTQYENE